MKKFFALAFVVAMTFSTFAAEGCGSCKDKSKDKKEVKSEAISSMVMTSAEGCGSCKDKSKDKKEEAK